MTPKAIAVGLLLVVAVGLALVCALGMLVAREALDRIHFLTPVSTVAVVALCVALTLEGPTSPAVPKTWLFALLVVVLGAVQSHALGRAARAWERRRGREEDQ